MTKLKRNADIRTPPRNGFELAIPVYRLVKSVRSSDIAIAVLYRELRDERNVHDFI